MARLVSLLVFLTAWALASSALGPRMLPQPLEVATIALEELKSGALLFNIGVTLLRVFAAFALAMVIGGVLGFVMGRFERVNALADAWLLILLNLPALVVIVLAYVWFGLTEVAAVLAVALNKIPNTAVTIREGARTLRRDLDELATVFQFSAWTRMRHILLPQLAPYVAASTRSGLSIIWKIVLVVELLGRSNGVGFEIGTAFQLFDVGRILAYAAAFIVVMLSIELCLVQPLERRSTRWRPRLA